MDPWRFINGTLVQFNTTATRDLVSRANESRDKLPDDARKMRVWALGTIKHVAAYANPFEPKSWRS